MNKRQKLYRFANNFVTGYKQRTIGILIKNYVITAIIILNTRNKINILMMVAPGRLGIAFARETQGIV